MQRSRIYTANRHRFERIVFIVAALGLFGCKAKREPIPAQANPIKNQAKATTKPTPGPKKPSDSASRLAPAQQALIDAKVRDSFGEVFRGKTIDIRRSGPWTLVAGQMVDSNGIRAKAEALTKNEDDGPVDNVFFGLLKSIDGNITLVEWSAGATDMPAVDWLEKHGLPRSMVP